MKGIIWETKNQRVAIVDVGGDETMDKDGSSMGSKQRIKSFNVA